MFNVQFLLHCSSTTVIGGGFVFINKLFMSIRYIVFESITIQELSHSFPGVMAHSVVCIVPSTKNKSILLKKFGFFFLVLVFFILVYLCIYFFATVITFF